MKLKNHWQKILIVLLIGILIFAITKCSEQKQWRQEYKENFQQKRDSFQSVINNKNQQIAIQEEKVINRKDKINDLEDSIEQLKQVNRQVRVETKTEIKEKIVKVDSPVYIDSNNYKYLRTPASFSKEEKWYSLNGTITDTGLIHFENIKFINKPTITVGLKDQGFFGNLNPFKKDEVLVTYEDKNPYTRVQSMENIKIKDEIRTNKNFGLGFFCGYGVVGSKTGIVIGGGVTWTPVKF